jgi:2,3-diketo-5-methylthio-1-phosphopentane phosphatase
MRTVFLCDFDGTIAPHDVGAALVRRFSSMAREEQADLLARWKAGALGHRALTEADCARMRVRESEALAFTRGFAIDPEFAPFVAEVQARGDEVSVLSEGFDFYIRDLLARAGLGAVAVAANRVRFDGDRLTPEFPHADPACPRCGNCKGRHVREWSARGWHTVFVGDGGSDRCGARVADVVLARGDLLAWCGDQGIPARSFAGFADVRAAFAA